MTIFDQALKHTLKWEGGYVNDPHDAGGETNYGISKRAHPNEDIANLTVERAGELYKTHYWDAMNCDALATVSQVIAAKAFDMGVNMGTYRGAKILQAAIQTLSPGLAVDGKIGPKTVNALAAVDLETVQDLVQTRLENFYKSLQNPRFEKGWLKRAKSWLEL